MRSLNSQMVEGYCLFMPSFHEQPYRPFSASLDGNTLEQFMRDTNDGANISAMSISRVAGSIIQPSTSFKNDIIVPHGFSQDRLAFYLRIDTPSAHGTTSEVISGYTDHCGISSDGYFDDNMEWHITAYNEIATVNQGRDGVTRALRTNCELMYSDEDDDRELIMMRPEDVVVSGQGDLLRQRGYGKGADRRFTLDNVAKMSHRSNAIGSHFITQLVNAKSRSVESVMEMDDGLGDEFSNRVDTMSLLRTEDYKASTASHLIKRVGQERDGKTFTTRQLENLWPNCTDRINVNIPKRITTDIRNFVLDECYDHKNNSIETILCDQIAQALLGVLSGHMLVGADVIIKSNPFSQEAEVFIPDHKPMFKNQKFNRQNLKQLEDNIYIEIVNGILLSNLSVSSFNIDVKILTIKDIDVMISINDQEAYHYCKPLYCNSSTLVTSEMEDLTAIDNSTSEIVNQIKSLDFDLHLDKSMAREDILDDLDNNNREGW